MSSENRPVRSAEQKTGRGHVAMVALALLLCTAVGFGVYAGYRAQAAPSGPPTLEEMERTGRVVLAYEHSEDDLSRMFDPSSERYFMVTVVADGQEYEVRVAGSDNIENVLKKAKIVLGPEDDMSHFPGQKAEPGMRIVVERWTRDTVVAEKIVPFETQEVKTSLLFPGKQSVVNEGQDGLAEQTFERILCNGVVVEQTLVSETIVEAPVNKRLLVGTEYAPISPYDFEWEFDKDGEPVGYADVMEGQKAAGYSARAGAGTACGYLPAAVGHVAVNPNEIPYGSKLYIRSADGKFVYGYAIAADTGTGLMQDIIDVDLFYSTYEESCFNGMRQVDIYILEYPSK